MFAAWLLASLAIGAGGTWLARRYALRRHLLDAPGERRAHTVPTPRGGGIGIVVALLLAGAWLLRDVVDPVALGAMLAGLALVALVGLVDDHRPLSPWLRLAVHAGACALLGFATWHQTGEPLLALVGFILSMVLTNVWNFMDGIDGIAATQALLVALAVAVLHGGMMSWWAWALAAATLGFLPFNFPKARIFLGDVGSGALGFALAALLMQVLAGAQPIHWALWMLPPSAFLIDASLTLAGRVLRGEPWWQPHALHAYQRWARRAGSHVVVTCAYAAWTLLSIGAMWMLSVAPLHEVGVLVFTVAWYTAGTGIWLLLQGPFDRKGSASVKEDTA
jgi:UDP-N-acetylmuramyl pentapeptide phosphotransferase/UDP-N-acetylglucosamine-1-phosphate transferase